MSVDHSLISAGNHRSCSPSLVRLLVGLGAPASLQPPRPALWLRSALSAPPLATPNYRSPNKALHLAWERGRSLWVPQDTWSRQNKLRRTHMYELAHDYRIHRTRRRLHIERYCGNHFIGGNTRITEERQGRVAKSNRLASGRYLRQTRRLCQNPFKGYARQGAGIVTLS